MSPLEHLGSEGASSYLCSLCCAWQRAHEIKKKKKAEPLRVDRNHGMTAELPQIKCMSSAGRAGIEWFKQFRDYEQRYNYCAVPNRKGSCVLLCKKAVGLLGLEA